MSNVREVTRELLAHWSELLAARADLARIEGALVYQPSSVAAARQAVADLAAGLEEVMRDLHRAVVDEELAAREAPPPPLT